MRGQVTDDLEAVAPLVVALADRYQDYENSGSSEWDRTVNVRNRPAWLRDAASVACELDGAHEDEAKLGDVQVEIDPFMMPVAPDHDVWEVSARACSLCCTARARVDGRAPQGSQAALNTVQLQNKHGTQLEQLNLMRQQLAAQRAEQQAQQAQQAEQYDQQLERLERLQKQLGEEHAEQQLTMRETVARIGAPGECDTIECAGPTRACYAEV